MPLAARYSTAPRLAPHLTSSQSDLTCAFQWFHGLLAMLLREEFVSALGMATRIVLGTTLWLTGTAFYRWLTSRATCTSGRITTVMGVVGSSTTCKALAAYLLEIPRW